MEDAVCTHDAAFVNLDSGVERGVVTDPHAAAHVDLGVDLAALADGGVLLDDREVADVALPSDLCPVRDRCAVADPLAAGFGRVVHFEQLQDAGARVVHPDECRGHRLRRLERPVDQHDRRARGVEERFVFGIREVGQRSGPALLDRGDGVHLGVLVADDVAAQEPGDHFGCKFHHK